MAEFCLDCFNRLNGTDYQESEVWTEPDLCEGCGKIKPCIVELRPKPLVFRLLDLLKIK